MADNSVEDQDLDAAFARLEALLPTIPETPLPGEKMHPAASSGRRRHWQCEDGWRCGYTTTKIVGGKFDGKFAAYITNLHGDKASEVYFKTRREAKAAAMAAFYWHSPRRAAKHGWNGLGYDK